jgi:hypothetical protein
MISVKVSHRVTNEVIRDEFSVKEDVDYNLEEYV